jgi:hypothetical protein
MTSVYHALVMLAVPHTLREKVGTLLAAISPANRSSLTIFTAQRGSIGLIRIAGARSVRRIRKLVVWPAVFATILLAFGAITYLVAQPIALIVDRAAWRYGTTIYSEHLNWLSWVVAAVLCTALVRWLGERTLGTGHAVSHRGHGITHDTTAPVHCELSVIASR